ncbi:hypothetical protein L596_001070 [Steinernema carpocapsae]|uniref:Uncharacterized protein n=1 Tax=Steinernema carpocapsae TaxID=34508 RepID=A0A4U8UKP5_STECR|nr:hypothetical protein L596_001070 [Steinernema carpocapsae]
MHILTPTLIYESVSCSRTHSFIECFVINFDPLLGSRRGSGGRQINSTKTRQRPTRSVPPLPNFALFRPTWIPSDSDLA